MLPIAILAGGLATRLRPATEKTPKALLPIAGRPFVLHQLQRLKGQGIERVVLCVGHMGDQIMDTVGSGKLLGLSIEYSSDGNSLLGTGGAIKRALPLLGEEFFVLYGDSYLLCSFSEVQAAYTATRSPALMAVLRNGNRWDKSNVLFKNGVLVEYNKHSPRPEMKHVDYGLSVLTSRVFTNYRNDTAFDLAAVYQELSNRGELTGYEVTERFYEIGSPKGLEETQEYLQAKEGKE